MSITEKQISGARLQSSNTKAVLVFLLYLVIWVPGLIANILFYKEGKRMQRIAGEPLPGVGCLSPMLWLNMAMVALGFAIAACVTSLYLMDLDAPQLLYGPFRILGLTG